MFVLSRDSGDARISAYNWKPGLKERMRRKWRRWRIRKAQEAYPNRPAGAELFSCDQAEPGAGLVQQVPDCDVLNLHWVAGFVDYAQFFRDYGIRTPIVWTLHDLNPMTGGCHYDGGCGRHRTGCGTCPQLGSSKPNDLSAEIARRKREALGNIPADRLHVVGPSRWIAGEAAASQLLGRFQVSVIPYGLDLDAFAPRDREYGRRTLGIPAHTKVVLLVAEATQNERKGFRFAAEATSGLRDCLVCTVGRGVPRFPEGVAHRHLGFVENDRLMSLIYSAADIFLMPSLEDNLPNTVMEAMACGLPVVAFAVGGVIELVRQNETGLLVTKRDVSALHGAVSRLLHDDQLRGQMAIRSRAVAEQEYPLARQAAEYLTLYERLAKSSSGCAAN
jgi:glycosyltransferase involved in cell wall biosynthesis